MIGVQSAKASRFGTGSADDASCDLHAVEGRVVVEVKESGCGHPEGRVVVGSRVVDLVGEVSATEIVVNVAANRVVRIQILVCGAIGQIPPQGLGKSSINLVRRWRRVIDAVIDSVSG